MLLPSISWLRRIAIAVAIVAAACALSWAASFWWRRLSLPWDSQTAIASAVPAVAVAGAIWWLWWRLPKRQVARLVLTIRDPKARADTEDNFRKTVGQVLGGAAVLIGAGLAYWQFTQQQQTAYQQILTQQKAAEDNRKASQDLLISNQVSKGFEQLAGTQMPMRLGGIYLLEGVMNTSEQYHRPVLETLCAFVRSGTISVTVSDNGPTIDIQAALSVTGRRKPGGKPGDVVDLIKANIPGANLYRANLSISDLNDINLAGAMLNRANLSYADLPNANLSAASLVEANLSGAHLTGANLSRTNFTSAMLVNADLRGASLSHAFLLSAQLDGANLSYTDLTQEQLNQACGTPRALPFGLDPPRSCPQ